MESTMPNIDAVAELLLRWQLLVVVAGTWAGLWGIRKTMVGIGKVWKPMVRVAKVYDATLDILPEIVCGLCCMFMPGVLPEDTPIYIGAFVGILLGSFASKIYDRLLKRFMQ